MNENNQVLTEQELVAAMPALRRQLAITMAWTITLDRAYGDPSETDLHEPAERPGIRARVATNSLTAEDEAFLKQLESSMDWEIYD